MLFIVVNEQLPGGWLEYLNQVRSSNLLEFHAAKEKQRCDAAAVEKAASQADNNSPAVSKLPAVSVSNVAVDTAASFEAKAVALPLKEPQTKCESDLASEAEVRSENGGTWACKRAPPKFMPFKLQGVRGANGVLAGRWILTNIETKQVIECAWEHQEGIILWPLGGRALPGRPALLPPPHDLERD